MSSSTIAVLAISDTHSRLSNLNFNKISADIFIHAGDLTHHGTKEELERAIQWLGELPFQHKIVIAGNHDIGLDKTCNFRLRLSRKVGSYATSSETDELIASMEKHNIIYLSPRNPLVELDVKGYRLRIYGLPYSPIYHGPSAFQRPRSEDNWANIQDDRQYDILISHGPPHGWLDKTVHGKHPGCQHFLAAVKRAKPTLAIFGHIHEARGKQMVEWEDGSSTTLWNAAVEYSKDKTVFARPISIKGKTEISEVFED